MESECLICFENRPKVNVYPCKHAGACSECSSKIKTCPICNDVLCVTINFKTLDGHLFTLQVNVNDTPETIQKLIHHVVRGNHPPYQIVYGGRVVKYDTPFGSFKNGVQMLLVGNLRGD